MAGNQKPWAGLKKLKIANQSSNFWPHLRCLPVHFRPHLQSLTSGDDIVCHNHCLRISVLQFPNADAALSLT